MTAVLHSVQDTRNPIQKMSRQELIYLARLEKRDDIVDSMPGDLMRRKFLDQPPSRMPRPMRSQLGSQNRLIVPPFDTWKRVAFQDAPVETEETVEETDALSDLEKQWQSQQVNFADMPFYQLKKECKQRGIKFTRTDRKTDLIEKLNGKDPA